MDDWSATLPLPTWGQPSAPGLFHIAFEAGTINELEDMGRGMKETKGFTEQIDQPMHLSVDARDPDGIPLEIVWLIPNADWAYEDLWRRPLDFDDAKARWGGSIATGSAAGWAA